MVLGFIFSFGLFVLYIMIYFLLVVTLFGVFQSTRMYKVVSSGENLKRWSLVRLIILVMSGVPPFSMFYLKMRIIYYMVGPYLFVFLVLLGTMLSTYFYFTFVTPKLIGCWRNKGGRSGMLAFSVIVLTIGSPVLLSL